MASSVRFVAPGGAARELVVSMGSPVEVVERLVRQVFDVGAQRLQFRIKGEPLLDDTFCTAGGEVQVEPAGVPRAFIDKLAMLNSSMLGDIVQRSSDGCNCVRLTDRVLYAVRSFIESARSIVIIHMHSNVNISVRRVDCVFSDAKSEDPTFDLDARRMLHSFNAHWSVPALVTIKSPQMSCLFLNTLPWSLPL